MSTQLCDGDQLRNLLEQIADRIAAGRKPGAALGLVGIRTRGLPIAQRIAEQLRQRHGVETEVGAVDTTLYRDDLDQGDRWPVLRGTDIPYNVDDDEIVLVDDVLNTGRSARAALTTVCDLGRPACVRLAVVVDRGGREMPIQADYLGLRCEAGRDERIVVRVTPVDTVDEVVRVTGSE